MRRPVMGAEVGAALLAEILFDMLESVLENFFRVTEISVNLNTYAHACACART